MVPRIKNIILVLLISIIGITGYGQELSVKTALNYANQFHHREIKKYLKEQELY